MPYPNVPDLKKAIGVWWKRRHDPKWGRVYMRELIRSDIKRLRKLMAEGVTESFAESLRKS